MQQYPFLVCNPFIVLPIATVIQKISSYDLCNSKRNIIQPTLGLLLNNPINRSTIKSLFYSSFSSKFIFINYSLPTYRIYLKLFLH